MSRNQAVSSPLREAFYWVGFVLALACVSLILAGNTEFFWRLQHASLPLSWVAGALSVLAFLAVESCDWKSENSPRSASSPEILQQELGVEA